MQLREENVVQIFLRQVKERGEHLAIVAADENSVIKKITYQQLDEESSRLAAYFTEKGIRQGQLVALLVNDKAPDGTMNSIIGMLALWKIRAAYLPIGLSESKEDIQSKIESSGSDVFLIDLDGYSNPHKMMDNLNYETITRKNLKESPTFFVALPHPDDLAYVMYTSGSTQGPRKGAATSHRGLPSAVSAILRTLLGDLHDLFAHEKVVHFTQMAVTGFDAKLAEELMALTIGATLFTVPLDIRKDPARFKLYCQKHHVTHITITPSELKNLNPADFPTLQCIVVMGEAFSKELIQSWLAIGKRIITGYGVTECTIVSTTVRCEIGKEITIGKPINGTKLYSLNENLEPISPHVIGEIYIGGIGVAEGYWQNGELTKERFLTIKDPDTQETVRVYKSGDLGRRLENEEWIVTGRIDHQVKIRGQRLELEHVESVLKKYHYHDKLIIKDTCVVAVKEDQKQLLVAYIELDDGVSLQDKKELRNNIIAYLKQNLTAFMIPLAMVFDKLPIADRGKVDRVALKKRGIPSNYFETGEFPEKAAEKVMAEMWLAVLELEKGTPIFRESDFFALGGNSLTVVSLINAIRKRFDIFPNTEKLTEAAIYECCILEDMTWVAKGGSLKELNNKKTPESVYFLHSLLGNGWSEYQKLLPDFPYEAYGYKALGLSDSEYLEKDFITLAKKYVHELLIAKNKKNLGSPSFEEPIVFVGWSAGGIIAIEMARQLRGKGYTNVHVVMLDTEMIHEATAQEVFQLGVFLNKILFREETEILFKEIDFQNMNLSDVIDKVFLKLEEKAAGKQEVLRKIQFVRCLFELQQKYLKTPEFKEAIHSKSITLIAAEETLKHNQYLGWSISIPCHKILDANHFNIIEFRDCVETLNREIAKIYEAMRFKDILEEMKAKYRTPIVKNQLLSEKTWRINKENYIPVTLSSNKENIGLAEIFNLFSKILIQGTVGSGKTLLLQFFAQQWSYQQLWQDRGFELVILLPLRKLPKQVKKSKDHDDLNLSKIVYYEYFGEEIDVQKLHLLHAVLMAKKDKILWMLDGFDEISGNELKAQLVHQKNVIITARPGYGEELGEFSLVSNNGFDFANIKKYLLIHIPSDKQKNIENLMSDKNLLSIPLILEMICVLVLSNELERDLNLNAVYRKISERLKIYECEKNPQIFLENIKDSAYRCLESCAFEAFNKGEVGFMNEATIEEVCEKFLKEHNRQLEKAKKNFPGLSIHMLAFTKEQLQNAVMRSGFLQRKGSVFEFIHLSFQEFLAAWYIDELSIDNIEEIDEEIIQSLILTLSNIDGCRRQSAIKKLFELGGNPKILEMLYATLDDEDEEEVINQWVLQGVVEILIELGRINEEILAVLFLNISSIEKEDFKIKEKAEKALIKIGEIHKEQYEKLIQSEILFFASVDPNDRKVAKERLIIWSNLDQKVVKMLILNLHHEDLWVRQSVAELILKLGGVNTKIANIFISHLMYPEIRQRAIEVLFEIGKNHEAINIEIRQHLFSLLSCPHEQTRESAAEALFKIDSHIFENQQPEEAIQEEAPESLNPVLAIYEVIENETNENEMSWNAQFFTSPAKRRKAEDGSAAKIKDVTNKASSTFPRSS